MRIYYTPASMFDRVLEQSSSSVSSGPRMTVVWSDPDTPSYGPDHDPTGVYEEDGVYNSRPTYRRVGGGDGSPYYVWLTFYTGVPVWVISRVVGDEGDGSSNAWNTIYNGGGVDNVNGLYTPITNPADYQVVVSVDYVRPSSSSSVVSSTSSVSSSSSLSTGTSSRSSMSSSYSTLSRSSASSGVYHVLGSDETSDETSETESSVSSEIYHILGSDETSSSSEVVVGVCSVWVKGYLDTGFVVGYANYPPQTAVCFAYMAM